MVIENKGGALSTRVSAKASKTAAVSTLTRDESGK
jgi:hypothetical protein